MTVSERADLDTMAASISERIRALPRHDAATLRALRRVVSKEVAAAPARESDGSQSDVLGASELAVRDADSVAAFLQRHKGGGLHHACSARSGTSWRAAARPRRERSGAR
jgi:hypothetical protein